MGASRRLQLPDSDFVLLSEATFRQYLTIQQFFKCRPFIDVPESSVFRDALNACLYKFMCGQNASFDEEIAKIY
jgi:hypothetical protein